MVIVPLVYFPKIKKMDLNPYKFRGSGRRGPQHDMCAKILTLSPLENGVHGHGKERDKGKKM